MTTREDRYTPEEESFDPEGIAELRRQDEEEELRRRIRREIIKVNSGESDEELDEERQRMAEEREQELAEQKHKRRRQNSILVQLFTGGFLSSSSAAGYFYMFIAVAAMCFICIFLTFMSLNADREYRQLQNQLMVLNERALMFEEQRYNITTRESIDHLLEQHDIRLKDLDEESKVIRSHNDQTNK